MGKCQQALPTAELLFHMNFNELFKHRLHLIFSLIRKILTRFESTFNTEKTKNRHIDTKILRGRAGLLTVSYITDEKKCCTALYVGTQFWEDLVRSMKYPISGDDYEAAEECALLYLRLQSSYLHRMQDNYLLSSLCRYKCCSTTSSGCSGH